LPGIAVAAESGRDLRVLVLGGGDGLAIRTILRHAQVARIDLVDLDERVVSLFRDQEILTALNEQSLNDPRVAAHYQDAFVFLREADATIYDLIVIDLPDPGSVSTNKLYTKPFYAMAQRHLTPGGALVTQASSPFYVREAFWCVVTTLEEAAREMGVERAITPYHLNVPSFGDWGFIMAHPGESAPNLANESPEPAFLTESVLEQALVFAPDVARVATEVNALSQPVLMRYYQNGWKRWDE
jgi:spermidine synthase